MPSLAGARATAPNVAHPASAIGAKAMMTAMAMLRMLASSRPSGWRES
jgi:hypothetical protein